jgi:hypothetical protein
MNMTWSEAGDINDDPVGKPLTPQISPKYSPRHTLTLVQIIESIFESIEKQEKYAIKISSENLDSIEKLTKLKPQYFKIVENTFKKYVQDGTIEANHIPYIISLIYQLYSLLLKYDLQPDEPTTDTCKAMAEFIFSVVIREQLADINDETSATLLILTCNNLLDSCIQLIKLDSSNPKKGLKVAEKYIEPYPVNNIAATTTIPVQVKSKNCCGC